MRDQRLVGFPTGRLLCRFSTEQIRHGRYGAGGSSGRPPAYLKLNARLDEKSSLMVLEPGEHQTTVDEQRQQIAVILAQSNSTVFVAEAGTPLAGYVAADGGEFRRSRDSASVVAGVLQSFSGQGLGTRVFQSPVEWTNGLVCRASTPPAWNTTAQPSRCSARSALSRRG